MLGYSSKHFRADLVVAVETEGIEATLWVLQFSVRAPLGNNRPATALQGTHHSFRLGARPTTQADFSRMLIDVGMSLEASTSSATA